jgi:hypothetical protein
MLLTIFSIPVFAQENTMVGSTDPNMMMLHPMIPAPAPAEIGVGMSTPDTTIVNEIMNATDADFAAVQMDTVDYIQSVIPMLQMQEDKATASGDTKNATMYTSWVSSAQVLSDQVNNTTNVAMLQNELFTFAQPKMNNSIGAEIVSVKQMETSTNLTATDKTNLSAAVTNLTALQTNVTRATNLTELVAAVENYMASAPMIVITGIAPVTTPATNNTTAPVPATNNTTSCMNMTNNTMNMTNNTMNMTNNTTTCMNMTNNTTSMYNNTIMMNNTCKPHKSCSDESKIASADSKMTTACTPLTFKSDSGRHACKPTTCKPAVCKPVTTCKPTTACKPVTTKVACKPTTTTKVACKPTACKTETCKTEKTCKPTCKPETCKTDVTCKTETKKVENQQD